MDLEKAFDTVPCQHLLEVLSTNYGVKRGYAGNHLLIAGGYLGTGTRRKAAIPDNY